MDKFRQRINGYVFAKWAFVVLGACAISILMCGWRKSSSMTAERRQALMNYMDEQFNMSEELKWAGVDSEYLCMRLCMSFEEDSIPFQLVNNRTTRWIAKEAMQSIVCTASFTENDKTTIMAEKFKATLIQDISFFAQENGDVSNTELAMILEKAFPQANPGNSEVKNIRAVVEVNGNLLFMGEIAIDDPLNVKEQIRKVFTALNRTRIFLGGLQ